MLLDVWKDVIFPKLEVGPYSNQKVVTEPLGLIWPFKFAAVLTILVAEFVAAVGAVPVGAGTVLVSKL